MDVHRLRTVARVGGLFVLAVALGSFAWMQKTLLSLKTSRAERGFRDRTQGNFVPRPLTRSEGDEILGARTWLRELRDLDQDGRPEWLILEVAPHSAAGGTSHPRSRDTELTRLEVLAPRGEEAVDLLFDTRWLSIAGMGTEPRMELRSLDRRGILVIRTVTPDPADRLAIELRWSPADGRFSWRLLGTHR